MTPTDCLLKSQNYVAAARMDPANPRVAFWLELAEVWRRRAFATYLGGEHVDTCFKVRAVETLPIGRPGMEHPAVRTGAQKALGADRMPAPALPFR